MTTTILVAGTASHVGKSTVAAGLCRLLADRGYRVAPFKAQNMSNNARVAPIPDAAEPPGDPRDETALADAAEIPGGTRGEPASPGESRRRSRDDPVQDAESVVSSDEAREWGEIGVSQYVQARAARRPATTDHNPVLLKPRGDAESQLIVHGRPVGHYSAGSYYDEHWETARAAAIAAHDRLAEATDVIIAEGAGGLGEINLHDRDLANVETARFADARVVVVADTERGGAFASLYGTLELMPEDARERVVGSVFTKFRGDESLLAPGIEAIEERTGVPVLGVVPYDDPGLPEEDSVSLPPVGKRQIVGDDRGDGSVTVAAVRLPRASNVTDLEPLARTPGVEVAWIPPDGRIDADAVILPGSKNTVDDLRRLREAGFGDRLAAFDGPIVGLCGGYQLLGERLHAAGVESTDDVTTVRGLGLLPAETTFARRKRIERTSYEVTGVGPLAGASGAVSGYEIHMGRTERTESVPAPVGPNSAATDRVLGTYLHGLFENRAAREAFVDRAFADADCERPDADTPDRSPHDAAAALIADLDLDPVLGGVTPSGGDA